MTATESILNARTPEDVFADLGTGREAQLVALKGLFRHLARTVHPDVNAHPDAAAAFFRLNEWYELASRQIESGTYGRRAGVVTVKAGGRTYEVTDKLARGDISEVFRCDWGTGAGVIKVVRHPRDNDLIRHEADTLRILEGKVEGRTRNFLPSLVDSVALKQSGGVIRQANVFDALDGFVTLERVMGRKGRIDPRDMAWMWRRLLYVLGAVHRAGFVHGAVLPSHVLIQPEEHGLALVDWCYAVGMESKVRAISTPYKKWYPDEVTDRQAAGAETDIYMGARTMLALMGGANGRPPLSIPAPLRAFFRACLLVRRLRPDDAWALQGTFDEVLERCYGTRKFRPFTWDRR